MPGPPPRGKPQVLRRQLFVRSVMRRTPGCCCPRRTAVHFAAPRRTGARVVAFAAMDAPAISLLPLLLGVPLAAFPAEPAGIAARIRARLASFEGIMGVAAKDLRTGEEVLVDADTRFPTASVIKVAVMLEVFHQVAEGRLSRDREVALPDAAKVGGTGVLEVLH